MDAGRQCGYDDILCCCLLVEMHTDKACLGATTARGRWKKMYSPAGVHVGQLNFKYTARLLGLVFAYEDFME